MLGSVYSFINSDVLPNLGKAAAAILEAYPILNMLLEEVNSTNQLIEACNIYMSSEFFKTELEVLTYFNYKVTFPYLHAIEKVDQVQLKSLLPKLYSDLSSKKLDTLLDYVVDIPGVIIKEPDSDLGKRILGLMCIEAGKGLKLQRGREYGFSDRDSVPPAAVVSDLSDAELQGLPTNNLNTERNLSTFDRRADKSAKCRNFRFTAKGIRNDVMLFKGNQHTVDKTSRKISAALISREKEWTKTQKEKLTKRIHEKLVKNNKARNYVKKLLEDCKTWSGPCTASEELLSVLKRQPEQAEFIVKTELAFFVHTHRADRLQCPELFRLNGISYEQKLENLLVLLSDNRQDCTATIANLPTNRDVKKALLENEESAEEVERDIKINEIRVVCWNIKEEVYAWFLGYIKRKEGENYLVDHLHRENDKLSKLWNYPTTEDIQATSHEQILDIKVEGHWDLLDTRHPKFILTNNKAIQFHFESVMQNFKQK